MYVCIYNMFVCMHVCMYVCVRVCMYVCMYVCVCMCVCVCACMYVYVYIDLSFPGSPVVCDFYACMGVHVCMYWVCDIIFSCEFPVWIMCMHVCMCVCVYMCM
jgi:hypothetical protein